MNISAPFITRPIATTLLMVGLSVLGIGAYVLLPIAGVPQVDIPTVQVRTDSRAPAPRPWRPPWRRRSSGSSPC